MAGTVAINHDRLFKEVITTFFCEFLELFSPHLANSLDSTSYIFMDKELFGSSGIGRNAGRHADIVGKARLKGNGSLCLIHIEPQAQWQSHFAGRMLHYFGLLHQKYAMPVYPIAVFSFDDHTEPQPSGIEVKIAGAQVLSFIFQVLQLNRLPWQQYVGQTSPIAAAFLVKMKHAQQERIEVKCESLRMIAKLKLSQPKICLLLEFIDTYLPLSAAEQQELEARIAKLDKPEKEEIMTIGAGWREQGIEQGLQEGLQKGRQEEAVSLVVRLLTKRFGPLNEFIIEQIQTFSLDRIERLSEALLDFTSIDELQHWQRLQEQE